MKILTRIIFVISALFVLLPVPGFSSALLNKRLYAESQLTDIFVFLIVYGFHWVYIIGSVGILFFKKWARNLLIYLTLFGFLFSYAGSFFVHLDASSDPALVELARSMAKFYAAIFIFSAIYLLLPKVKKLFV